MADGRIVKTNAGGGYELPRSQRLGFMSLIPRKVSISSLEVSHPDFGTQTAWIYDTSENSGVDVFLWPFGFGGVPSPCGNFPSVMQILRKGKTAYFAFSVDHGVPFNPVELPSSRQRWDLSLTYRFSRQGSLLEINNRSGVDIPIVVSSGGEQHRSARGNSRLTLPIGQSGETVGFFFHVYDTASIKWPAEFAHPPWLPPARPPRRVD